MNLKISITLLMLAMASGAFAQKMKVANAITLHEEGDLQKAYTTIQETLNPNDPVAAKKTLNWPRAWEVKGAILYDVHKMGMRNVVYEPLQESYKAYRKAMELDSKNRLLPDIKEALKQMQPDLAETAVKAYKLGRFDVALNGFKSYLEIARLPLLKDEVAPLVDTTIYYNAGLAAFSAKAWPEALEYFSITSHKAQFGEDSFFYLYGIHQSQKDTLKQYETLKKGFERYPMSENINIELVKFCIETKRPQEAVNYIDVAIQRLPENATFYTLKGRALEDAGQETEAIEAYLKAIELDVDLFVPTYNLAVIYFNRGVNVINSAIRLPQDEDEAYELEVARGTLELVNSLPLFEKAQQLNPNDQNVKESLKIIHEHIEKNKNN